ncbi:DUF3068 domain-containing protein [Phytohabitans rumicis]|uniref:DUF3068 domain-containing protein n=1 Tax=Phytohabitans rumicis TaxID=1076125 RepID=A0A6V8LNG7_9ACTN|nr:DUF3068 domain-containing protein [Phytohabitans rumicis]GFJ96408.1 hypothetical protein Prum_100500 [Phytohabitans rumicis]
MKKRVVGAALFGTGLFLLVVAVALAFVVTPLASKMPFDLEPPVTNLDAPNATFVQARMEGGEPTIGVQQATLRASTGIQPDVGAAAELPDSLVNKTVVWNVFQNIKRTDNGEVINATESRIALDRKSGAAANWSGQCYTDQEDEPCRGGNINYRGQLYAFPFGTEKKTYQYYDSTLHTALPINYEGTETVNGLEAYRFRQVVPEQQATMDEELKGVLLGVFAPGSTSGTVQYNAARTLWVEPVTGSIIDYQEEQHRVLVSNTGVRTTLLDAVFRYTPQTRQTVVDKAGDGRSTLLLLGRWIPIGLTVLALLLLAFGYLLTRGAVRAGAPVAAVPTQPATGPDRTAVPQT